MLFQFLSGRCGGVTGAMSGMGYTRSLRLVFQLDYFGNYLRVKMVYSFICSNIPFSSPFRITYLFTAAFG